MSHFWTSPRWCVRCWFWFWLLLGQRLFGEALPRRVWAVEWIWMFSFLPPSNDLSPGSHLSISSPNTLTPNCHLRVYFLLPSATTAAIAVPVPFYTSPELPAWVVYHLFSLFVHLFIFILFVPIFFFYPPRLFPSSALGSQKWATLPFLKFQLWGKTWF